MVDPSKFGVWHGSDLVQIGTCGEGGYFNDTDYICTCTVMTGRCWTLQMRKYILTLYILLLSLTKVFGE